MQVSPRTLLPLCIVLIFISHQCSSQFFTKIANSIPRMGKRYELPAVIRKVAKTLRFVIETVETYDKDGNGELNPEELMDVPVIQNAVRNFIENKDSRGQSQYPKGGSESESTNKDQNIFFDERMIMRK